MLTKYRVQGTLKHDPIVDDYGTARSLGVSRSFHDLERAQEFFEDVRQRHPTLHWALVEDRQEAEILEKIEPN